MGWRRSWRGPRLCMSTPYSCWKSCTKSSWMGVSLPRSLLCYSSSLNLSCHQFNFTSTNLRALSNAVVLKTSCEAVDKNWKKAYPASRASTFLCVVGHYPIQGCGKNSPVRQIQLNLSCFRLFDSSIQGLEIDSAFVPRWKWMECWLCFGLCGYCILLY